jgi:hypothetical protein
MRARTPGALAVGILLFLCTALAAQIPSFPQGATQPGPPVPRMQMPPRDGAAAEVPKGTARIRGRVVTADNGTPLRRAQVRISAAELRVNRTANTDAEGLYEFSELPVGRYNVFVARSGYVSLQFGQRRPFESGRPLEVSDAQIVEKIDFALPRGGVIAGRVTDEVGEPLAGVRMQAMRYQYLPNGQRQLTPVGGSPFSLLTNDLGEFRLYSLMPGTYIVSAAPVDFGGMMTSPGAPASPGAPNDGHGITYYPGTINVDDAQSITVGLAEVANASFALVPQRMTRVTGLVRDSQGRPLAANLTLRTHTGTSTSMRMLAMAGPDGRFSVASVPPGEHFIEVSPRPGGDESASVPITAGGQDITDLLITTSPGKTISGQVMFEGGAAAQTSFRVNAMSPDPGGPGPTRIYDNTQGVIDDKGRFQVRGLGGRAVFNVSPTMPGAGGAGWFLKSVTIDGENFTDIPFDLSTARDDTKVEIVMTDKQTTLSGMVKNARGEQVTDYTVVMFPDRLREGAMPARYTRAVRPDQQGRFETRGLPPGDYFAVAVESLEQGGHWDPAFRKQIEPVAKRFRLTEGQAATIELALMQ